MTKYELGLETRVRNTFVRAGLDFDNKDLFVTQLELFVRKYKHGFMWRNFGKSAGEYVVNRYGDELTLYDDKVVPKSMVPYLDYIKAKGKEINAISDNERALAVTLPRDTVRKIKARQRELENKYNTTIPLNRALNEMLKEYFNLIGSDNT